jgi:hypothetical protein
MKGFFDRSQLIHVVRSGAHRIACIGDNLVMNTLSCYTYIAIFEGIPIPCAPTSFSDSLDYMVMANIIHLRQY